MSNHTLVGVDVAKAVFEVAISDRPGHVSGRERLPRAQFLPFFAQLPAATVVMEACGSAHYWGQRLEQLGHKVVLLPPHQVRPYVKGNKTDRTDAKGILEAFRNEAIRPVPVKTVSQQTLTTLHRFRSGWMGERGNRQGGQFQHGPPPRSAYAGRVTAPRRRKGERQRPLTYRGSYRA